MLTSLGIGEALVTALSEKGIPTPLAAVHLRAPMSRIGTLSPEELKQSISASALVSKYNEVVDRESAYEILTQKIENAAEEAPERKKSSAKKEEKSVLEKASENVLVRQVGRTVVREVTRGLLGVLGIGGSRRKKGWF